MISCILVLESRKALTGITLTVFDTRNEMRVHIRFACTCNIFRECAESSCACPIFRREKFTEETKQTIAPRLEALDLKLTAGVLSLFRVFPLTFHEKSYKMMKFFVEIVEILRY